MSKELIRLKNCSMAFDDTVVLDDINLYIRDKEFLTLLGPSGCGKTTTLRIIGGFQTPTSGDILFDGVRINDVPPYKRTVNTVFQKYALFPHLNVFDNIAFGLRIPKTDANGKTVKIPEEEIHERVMEMLEVVNLKGFELTKEEIVTINDIEMYRYEGTMPYQEDGKSFVGYTVGYSFIMDGVPCTLVGSVTDPAQSDEYIKQVMDTVEAMIKTLRSQK